jgi:hypothetical protein
MPHEQQPARAATGSIDALFAGAAPSRDDVAAASTLADAFPATGAGAAPADGQIGGRPAHPATTELSLDHVFREGGGTDPGARAAAGAREAGGRASGAGVSFDQFFSQGAQGGAGGGAESPAAAPQSGGSDDIEQFNAWLQGLKKR